MDEKMILDSSFIRFANGKHAVGWLSRLFAIPWLSYDTVYVPYRFSYTVPFLLAPGCWAPAFCHAQSHHRLCCFPVGLRYRNHTGFPDWNGRWKKAFDFFLFFIGLLYFLSATEYNHARKFVFVRPPWRSSSNKKHPARDLWPGAHHNSLFVNKISIFPHNRRRLYVQALICS